MYWLLNADGAPEPEEFEPIAHPQIGYVAITEGERFYGIAICARSGVRWEVHNAMMPEVGWKKRLEITRAFWQWAGQCGCRRVFGRVAQSNRYTLRFNKEAGMTLIGIDKKTVMRGGVLEDEHLFGISLPVGGVPSRSE
jgi:hypothetical protein